MYRAELGLLQGKYTLPSQRLFHFFMSIPGDRHDRFRPGFFQAIHDQLRHRHFQYFVQNLGLL